MSERMESLLKDIDKEGVRIEGWHCVFIAVCAVIIFTFFYLWIDSLAFDPATGQKYISLKNMTMSILIQLVSVCVLFILSYFMLRRIYGDIHEKNKKDLVNKVSDTTLKKILPHVKITTFDIFERFEDVSWSELINSSSKIDIITHYLGSWISNQGYALAQFFVRGGQIRIILPDYESDEIAEIIKSRFSERSLSISQRVDKTISKFMKLVTESGNKASQFQHNLSNGMIWYCAIRFDNDKLIIYPFGHSKRITVYRPTFLIDINEFKHVNAWFEKEMEHHMENVKE